jgi:ABC-type Fe3+-siderophore transport system permease subunit
MIPTSLIMVLLVVGFFSSSFAFFFTMAHNPLVDRYTITMFGTGAVMVFAVVLAIIPVQLVWLSWVLLVIAVGSLVIAIRLLRTSLVIMRARERELAARMAKGG